MARKVIWIPAAYEDLERIWDYIARDSLVYARMTVARIVTSARDLSRFPGIGRIVPEFDDPRLRERIVKSYRLIYRVERERVVVLAIIHGARQLPDEIRYRN